MEKMENEGNPLAAEKILSKLKENQQSLHIARIPNQTKKEFQKLAEEEFCGDYGMALKWLIDDTISKDMRVVLATLEDHHIRLATLERQGQGEAVAKTEKKKIKKLDGSEVKLE